MFLLTNVVSLIIILYLLARKGSIKGLYAKLFFLRETGLTHQIWSEGNSYFQCIYAHTYGNGGFISSCTKVLINKSKRNSKNRVCAVNLPVSYYVSGNLFRCICPSQKFKGKGSQNSLEKKNVHPCSITAVTCYYAPIFSVYHAPTGAG